MGRRWEIKVEEEVGADVEQGKKIGNNNSSRCSRRLGMINLAFILLRVLVSILGTCLHHGDFQALSVLSHRDNNLVCNLISGWLLHKLGISSSSKLQLLKG